MTDTLRYIPRYIRNTDAFGWQGADSPDGPWRSITPPQSSAPWQTTSPMDALPQTSAEVSGAKMLSPAAQSVWDAFNQDEAGMFVDYGDKLAAALRAAANQVGPKETLPFGHIYSAPAEEWHYQFKLQAKNKLLAIANELENQ